MCDEWMPALQLPLTWEQFLQLPRNPAYKYEYLEGKAFLSPRPSHYWAEPPPTDCIARRLGRPHLTWIFVAPSLAGGGVGTGLLSAAVSVLLTMGFRELVTTFIAGNDSSMLWHWRNGFQLLPYPG